MLNRYIPWKARRAVLQRFAGVKPQQVRLLLSHHRSALLCPAMLCCAIDVVQGAQEYQYRIETELNIVLHDKYIECVSGNVSDLLGTLLDARYVVLHCESWA